MVRHYFLFIALLFTLVGNAQNQPNGEPYKIQEIPKNGEDYGILNVAYFNLGGEGVAYHEKNTEETEFNKHCNAGAEYSGLSDVTKSFRYNECVDISHVMAGLGANWGMPGDGYGTVGNDLHNLMYTEPGEWINYTVDIKKKGYYTIHCLTSPQTGVYGTIGFRVVGGNQDNQNGNIIRSWSKRSDKAAADEWISFRLAPTEKCGLYVDGSQERGAEGAQIWNCWGWNKCGGDRSEDLTVLFKYEGVQTLQLLISPDVSESPGDLSNFYFEFKSDDIPDWEFEDENKADIIYDGIKYKKSGNNLKVVGLTPENRSENIIIPASIKVEGVVYPVTKVENNAFEDLTFLKSVRLESIESVGEAAFWGCSQLTAVELPKVNTINDYAFKNCSSLKSVSLGNGNDAHLGRLIFDGCKLLNFKLKFGRIVESYEKTFDGMSVSDLLVDLADSQQALNKINLEPTAIVVTATEDMALKYIKKGVVQALSRNRLKTAADVNGSGSVTGDDAQRVYDSMH